MKLDRRKEMILAAVVSEYVDSGHPVGSRTVVKSGVKKSAATIRNEMVELEEMGLLEQPHTSAGRVPTDFGFRYYVDNLMSPAGVSTSDERELKSVRQSRELDVEELILATASKLAELSRRVGVIMLDRGETDTLSAIHLGDAGRKRIRVVFVFEKGTMEERIIRDEWGLDPSFLERLGNLLNASAKGRTLQGLRRELGRKLEEAKRKADLLLAGALELSGKLVSMGQREVYVRGQANLLDLDDFTEIESIREVMRTLEERRILARLFEESLSASGTRILIGEENEIESLKGCSLISIPYGNDDEPIGSLGLIGPKRTDYARLVPLVRFTGRLISQYLARSEPGEIEIIGKIR